MLVASGLRMSLQDRLLAQHCRIPMYYSFGRVLRWLVAMAVLRAGLWLPSPIIAQSAAPAPLLKTYHEIANPIALLNNLRLSLKPGARIGIIDRNGNGENHGVGKDVVIREASQAGYELRDSQDFVKGDGMDYFLIFTAKAH